MPRANKINDGRYNAKIEDPVRALAMAIITRAVWDLQQGVFTVLAGNDMERIESNKRRKETIYKGNKYKDEAVAFFNSRWYRDLTEMLDLEYSGTWMIDHCEAMGIKFYREWLALKSRSAKNKYWSSHKVKY